jgi:hypothetical protein
MLSLGAILPTTLSGRGTRLAWLRSLLLLFSDLTETIVPRGSTIVDGALDIPVLLHTFDDAFDGAEDLLGLTVEASLRLDV